MTPSRANQFFKMGYSLGWQLYCHPDAVEN
jgi:hypothetical protein